MNRIGLFVASVLIVLMILSSTLFIVDQKSVGVVYVLGEIKEVITEPGLKAKLPPPFQNVVFLDKRIQTLDSTETRAIFTAEKKSLVIDWLAKWRIAEPRQFIAQRGNALVEFGQHGDLCRRDSCRLRAEGQPQVARSLLQ